MMSPNLKLELSVFKVLKKVNPYFGGYTQHNQHSKMRCFSPWSTTKIPQPISRLVPNRLPKVHRQCSRTPVSRKSTILVECQPSKSTPWFGPTVRLLLVWWTVPCFRSKCTKKDGWVCPSGIGGSFLAKKMWFFCLTSAESFSRNLNAFFGQRWALVNLSKKYILYSDEEI